MVGINALTVVCLFRDKMLIQKDVICDCSRGPKQEGADRFQTRDKLRASSSLGGR